MFGVYVCFVFDAIDICESGASNGITYYNNNTQTNDKIDELSYTISTLTRFIVIIIVFVVVGVSFVGSQANTNI